MGRICPPSYLFIYFFDYPGSLSLFQASFLSKATQRPDWEVYILLTQLVFIKLLWLPRTHILMQTDLDREEELDTVYCIQVCHTL